MSISTRRMIKGRAYMYGKTLSELVAALNERGFETLKLNTFSRYLRGLETPQGAKVLEASVEVLDEWEKELGAER